MKRNGTCTQELLKRNSLSAPGCQTLCFIQIVYSKEATLADQTDCLVARRQEKGEKMSEAIMLCKGASVRGGSSFLGAGGRLPRMPRCLCKTSISPAENTLLRVVEWEALPRVPLGML